MLKIYTKAELDKILKKHNKWLQNEAGGERADLSSSDLRFADLRYADLRSADLSSADLRFANLRSANLRSANLRYANLSSADLSSADLSSADLSSAHLRYADLRSANLRSADLSYADLSFADLSSADLRYAKNKEILTFSAGKHFAYACDGNIYVGCLCKTIKEWVVVFEEVGKLEGYTEREIKLYGDFIKYCNSVMKN